MSDTLEQVESWKKAGEELRAGLQQERTAALAELARVDLAISRLDSVFGRPTTALAPGQSKRIDTLAALKPWFRVLEPKLREIVELRAAGLTSEAIVLRLGGEKKNVQNLFYKAKAILRTARETSTPPADDPPANDSEEDPAATPPLMSVALIHAPTEPVAPRERRPRAKRREPATPNDSEPEVARPKDAGFAAFTSEMRQHTVLDREGELELFNRWKQTGDRRLADQLVSANLRLVLSIAQQYDRKRHDILDLVQEGSIGLFHALSKYDPTRGIRFISYASHWIRAYMLKFIIANHHLVKLGTTQEQRKLFFNLRKTRALLEKDGSVATVEQIAEALEVRVEDVIEMETRLGAAPVSIDAPVRDAVGEETPLFHQFAASDDWRPDVQVETADFRDTCHERIHVFGALLEDRDRIIFEKRLIAEDPMTLIEIAEEFGVTRERVRQIEARLIERMRRFLTRASA